MGVKQLRTNLVRPLPGAADEEGVSTPQSVGFWKASLTVLANNFKLAGLACLSLATVATLTINIISSNYGATPALAAGFTTTGPATIGISTPGNVDLGSITSSGGTKIASHTLTIKTNAVKGYNVTLSSNSEQTGLTNTDGTTTIPTITTNGTLANNTWGYSIDGSSSATTIYRPIKQKSTIPADIIASSTNPTSDTGNVKTITYGVRVDDPNTMKAGTYETEVVYTATANLPAAPTITGISPNTINTGDTKQITITGTNLASAYQTFIDLNNNGKQDNGEQCTSPTVTDTTITCIAPASSTAATYNVYVVTQGGTTNKQRSLTYAYPAPTISSINPNSIYTGNSTTVITIAGTNLSTASGVYVDLNNNGKQDANEICKNLKVVSSTSVTCTAPASGLAGSYVLTLTTRGGNSKAPLIYVQAVPKVEVTKMSGSTEGNVGSASSVNMTISGSGLTRVRSIKLSFPLSYLLSSEYCAISSQADQEIICTMSMLYPGSVLETAGMTITATVSTDNESFTVACRMGGYGNCS